MPFANVSNNRTPRDEGRTASYPQLDATAATHQENYKESQLYTLGGKQRTRAPSPDAELEYMFVMSMVVQYRWCGSVRCGQRRSRARALAEQSRHRRHGRVVQRRARAPRPGLGLRGERRERGRQAPRLLGREHIDDIWANCTLLLFKACGAISVSLLGARL